MLRKQRFCSLRWKRSLQSMTRRYTRHSPLVSNSLKRCIQDLPNTRLLIEATSDGVKLTIYQISMGVHSVDVSGNSLIQRHISSLLTYSITQSGFRQTRPIRISTLNESYD